MLINVKMPTIVGILAFMSRINFVLSCDEHEKKFYNLIAWVWLFDLFLNIFSLSSLEEERAGCHGRQVCVLCLFLVMPWVVCGL